VSRLAVSEDVQEDRSPGSNPMPAKRASQTVRFGRRSLPPRTKLRSSTRPTRCRPLHRHTPRRRHGEREPPGLAQCARRNSADRLRRRSCSHGKPTLWASGLVPGLRMSHRASSAQLGVRRDFRCSSSIAAQSREYPRRSTMRQTTRATTESGDTPTRAKRRNLT
jgi:hypothetical protein